MIQRKTAGRVKKAAIIVSAAIVSHVLLSMLSGWAIFAVLFVRADGSTALDLLPEDLETAWRECEFDSDGAALYGILLLPEGGSRALIVIAPGMNSGARTHLTEAQVFAKNGFAAFTYDPTGVGKSTGDGVIGLSRGKTDLAAAVRYLKQDPALASLPLILYGHSAGGYAAAAASDLGGVCGVICAAAFDRPTDVMLVKARQFVSVIADLQSPFIKLQNFFVFGADGDESASAALERSGVPALVIRSFDDPTVPDEISLASGAAGASNCRIADATHPGHSFFWLTEEARDLRASDPEKTDAAGRRAANETEEEYFSLVLSFCSEIIVNHL